MYPLSLAWFSATSPQPPHVFPKSAGKSYTFSFFLIFFIKYDGLVQVVYRATFDNQLWAKQKSEFKKIIYKKSHITWAELSTRC